MIAVWVTVAGAVGGVARFVVDGAVRARWPSSWPWATLLINVTGSLLLGAVTGLVVFDGAPQLLRTVAGVGFCGGYTTFGTASFETVRLLQQGRYRAAVVYAGGSLLAATAAAGLGLLLGFGLAAS